MRGARPADRPTSAGGRKTQEIEGGTGRPSRLVWRFALRAWRSEVVGAIFLAAAASGPALGGSVPSAKKSIVVVLDPTMPSSSTIRLERLAGWLDKRALHVELGTEGAAASRLPLLRVGTVESRSLARALGDLPVRFGAGAIIFDGRTYGGADLRLGIRAPGPGGRLFAIGTTPEAALRAASELLFELADGHAPEPGYRLAVGQLARSGAWVQTSRGWSVDSARERDELAARDRFERNLIVERESGVVWRFPASLRAFARSCQRDMRRFAAQPEGSVPVVVTFYPTEEIKALYTGSSRPVDLVFADARWRCDLAADAPPRPDLIASAMAEVALARSLPRGAPCPSLLPGWGAFRAGTFWGRPAGDWAAILAAAGVAPALSEILADPPPDNASPIFLAGEAAALLAQAARHRGLAGAERLVRKPARFARPLLAEWLEEARRRKLSPPRRRPLPEKLLLGFSLAMTNRISGSYLAESDRRTLAHLQALSGNSVSIMPFGFEREASSPVIEFLHRDPRGETDEAVVHGIADARRFGMSVLDKPQIWVGGGGFTGDIAPANPQEAERWFAAYRRFIVHHAIVAEAAGASLFCVGTELTGTERWETPWRHLIAAVRQVTGAPLLYAANWAGGASAVPFWDALDAIGVDFYDPIASTDRPSDRELEAGVARVIGPLAALAARTGKPVIFTEVGYPAVEAPWRSPHDGDSKPPSDGSSAARAAEAFFRVVSGRPWTRGFYWWKVFSSGEPADAARPGFNVLGQPIEKVISRWYARLRAASSLGPARQASARQ
jgi:Glycoside Hydrolase Family 113